MYPMRPITTHNPSVQQLLNLVMPVMSDDTHPTPPLDQTHLEQLIRRINAIPHLSQDEKDFTYTVAYNCVWKSLPPMEQLRTIVSFLGGKSMRHLSPFQMHLLHDLIQTTQNLPDLYIEETDRHSIKILENHVQELSNLLKRLPNSLCYIPSQLSATAQRISSSTRIPLETLLSEYPSTQIKIHNGHYSYIKKTHTSKIVHQQEIDILHSMPPNHYVMEALCLIGPNKSIFLTDTSDTTLAMFQKKIRIVPIDTQYKITEDLLKALSFLAQNDIVHCNLTPDNVVEDNKKWKITDFCLSHHLTQGKEKNIAETNWEKTYSYYRPPEDFKSIRPLNKVTISMERDLWALGAILYKVYTNTHLIEHKTRDTPDSLYQRLHNQFWTPSGKLNPLQQTRSNERLNRHAQKNPACNGHPLATKIKTVLQTCLELIPQNRTASQDLLHHHFQVHYN